MSLDPRGLVRSAPGYCGKLRSNFLGTEFTAFDTDGSKPVYPVRGAAAVCGLVHFAWTRSEPCKATPNAAHTLSKHAAAPRLILHRRKKQLSVSVSGIIARGRTMVSPDMPSHLCPTCDASCADGRLGRARPELAAVAFGVNVLGIKGPRKMMALLPRLPEGSAAVTGFRPSPYGKTALLDRCVSASTVAYVQASRAHLAAAFAQLSARRRYRTRRVL